MPVTHTHSPQPRGSDLRNDRTLYCETVRNDGPPVRISFEKKLEDMNRSQSFITCCKLQPIRL